MLSLKPIEASKVPASTVYAVEEAKGNDRSLDTLLNLMDSGGLMFYKSRKAGAHQSPRGLIASEDVVLVKVNSQWDECGMTNTDVVKAIITALLKHPDGFAGEVVVVDNGQAQYGSSGHGGSLSYKVNNAENRGQSVEKVVRSFENLGRISTYLWDTITEREVREYSDGDDEDGYVVAEKAIDTTGLLPSYPKFMTAHGGRVSFKMGVWDPEKKLYESDRLKIINTPVLKAHFIFWRDWCCEALHGRL
jgi:hypothetical protein